MFSSHKQLIGSPNDSSDRPNPNSEFTPIGVRSRNSNKLSTNSAKIRTNIDGSPSSANRNSRSQLLHRNKFDGSSSFSNENSEISNSSFENDEKDDDNRNIMRHNKRDLFSNGSILRGTNVLPNYSSDEESIGTIKDDGLIRNKETNMLKLQSDQARNLQGENMNLRVEVMSLRRNLTGLPVETNELIDQNITLNQEIVRLRELVQNYQLRESKFNNNENADHEIQFKQYEGKIENLENKLQNIIDERDDKAQEIERLNDEIDILNNKLEQRDQEIEERRIHEDSIVSIHNDNDQELNDLQTDLKFREQEIDNLHDEIEELNLKIKHLNKENDLLREDLDQIETKNNIDSEPNKLQDFEHQKIQLQTRIDQLEEELREIKSEKIDLKKYIDKLEEDEEKEVRKQYKSSRDLLRDMSDQLDNASKSIDTLENELKQKDSDIKQLNSKVLNLQTKNSELIERLEKLKNSKSKTTDLLTNEIDDVYAKINELKEINIKLESENHELSQSLSNNEGYDNDYVEDIKEDREILYNSLLKTEKKLIEKLSEVKSLNDTIKILERKVKNNEEINQEPRNNNEKNSTENIELITNLQSRIEEERDKHIDTIENLKSKFNNEKNNLIYKIETLEEDKLRLIEDYENIQIAYRDLEVHFEKEVNQNAVVCDFNDLESDFKNLSIQYKIAVDNKLIYETEIEELKNKIKLKDLELLELHNDLTKLSTIEKSTDIRTKLESKIILIEEKVVKLTNERNELLNNNLQADEELNKIKLENIKLNKKVDASQKIYFQLEVQLDEANKDKKVLRLELKEQNKEITRLEKNISKLEMERGNLIESLDRLNIDQNNIIKKNDQLSDHLKYVSKDHGDNKNDLEIKFNEKENQFNRLVDEYNTMKNDLLGKYEGSKLERIKLAGKLTEKEKILNETKRKFELSNGKVKVLEKYVDEQNKEIDSIKVELTRARDQLQDQKQWFPPTPESPSRISVNQQSILFTLQNRIDILEAQKKLIMIKLQELKTESGDLQFMIHYLEAEIKSKNSTIERNIILLRTANINTISASKKSKLTFKGVAFAVLASIRLKNRLTELKERRAQEIAVKKQLTQKQKHL